MDQKNLRIASDGNIGIGTDNPQMKLVVSTDGNGIEFNPKVGGTNDNRILSYDRVANIRRGLDIDAQSFEYRKDLETRLKILSDGKVGIGTDDPLNLLDVHQSSGRQRFNEYGHYIAKNNSASITEYWTFAPRSGGSLGIGRGVPDAEGTVAAANDKLLLNLLVKLVSEVKIQHIL